MNKPVPASPAQISDEPWTCDLCMTCDPKHCKCDARSRLEPVEATKIGDKGLIVMMCDEHGFTDCAICNEESSDICENCDADIERSKVDSTIWIHKRSRRDLCEIPVRYLYAKPKIRTIPEPVEAPKERLDCYCDQIICPICYPPVEAVSTAPVKACHCGLDACIGVDKLIALYVCVRGEDDPCKMTDKQYEEYINGPDRAKWEEGIPQSNGAGK